MMSKNVLKKKNLFFVIMLIITGLYILFIWWHSTRTAVESTVESTSILAIVEKFLRSIGVNAELTDHIIRKLAHFCEFALLGLLTVWTSYARNKLIVRNLMSCGFVCLAVAVVDELVQIGAEGRSAEVTDVALDFCGAVAGVLFFIIILLIVRLFKRIRRG